MHQYELIKLLQILTFADIKMIVLYIDYQYYLTTGHRNEFMAMEDVDGIFRKSENRGQPLNILLYEIADKILRHNLLKQLHDALVEFGYEHLAEQLKI